MSDEEVSTLMAEMDVDENGKISLDEWCFSLPSSPDLACLCLCDCALTICFADEDSLCRTLS